MKEKVKICRCPNCHKPVDITNWNEIDPMICICCCEQFELNDIDKSTVIIIGD